MVWPAARPPIVASGIAAGSSTAGWAGAGSSVSIGGTTGRASVSTGSATGSAAPMASFASRTSAPTISGACTCGRHGIDDRCGALGGQRADQSLESIKTDVVERGSSLGDRQWGTGQTARLDLVPAVCARVLPAGHAEVEGPMERIELLGCRITFDVRPGRGEGFVERRVVRHDEVLQAPPKHLQPAHASLSRRGRLERVARAAPLAEGFGKDLGHRPRVAPIHARAIGARVSEYRPAFFGFRSTARTGLIQPAVLVPGHGRCVGLW